MIKADFQRTEKVLRKSAFCMSLLLAVYGNRAAVDEELTVAVLIDRDGSGVVTGDVRPDFTFILCSDIHPLTAARTVRQNRRKT